MEQKVVIDWSACVALGMVTIGIILAGVICISVL